MDYALAREAMIESQVRPNDVTDVFVLAALKAVAKERFVPDHLRAVAYADCPLRVSDDRTLWGARDFARLLQAAAIAPTDRILDIAGAPGYSAAILARLGGQVISLESDVSRATALRETLASVGARADVVAGPLKAGWTAGAPYNVIWVNGAVEAVPQAWLDQLADGGRCAVVVRDGALARASVYTRAGKATAVRTPFEASVPPLPGFERETSFRF